MGSLSTIFVLAVAIQHVYGYALAPRLSWPEDYHFNGEDINLVTGVVKTFEIWYSSQHNRSRIDEFGGVSSRYYYGVYFDEDDNEVDGKIYMFHPEVAEDDSETIIKCTQVPSWGDFEDFLPSLSSFTYSGEEEHDGKQVQVWKRDEVNRWSRSKKKEETILVGVIDDDVGVPLHHTTKTFSIQDGSLLEHTVINYYNFRSNIKLKELRADHSDCAPFHWGIHDIDHATRNLRPSINSDVDLAFHMYKKHHGLSYDDKEEHHYRKSVFQKNWEKIVEHNKKNLSYKLGINQFADKTIEELGYLSGVRGPSKSQGTHPFPHTELELEQMASEFPENYDLRTEGFISPVRNQAHCGSCWAFAGAATMEGALSRALGGEILDLSEQSLVDCAWPFRSHGCMGTEAIDAVFEYLLKHGIPTVADYGPYLEADGYCRVQNMTNVYKIKGFAAVTRQSPNAMKATLLKYGPVNIGIYVTDSMVRYKSGVFYDNNCEPGPQNHAVTLVGYGVRDGDLYWIVKNSWGEAWGESGYILMSANKDNCNVMQSPYYPIV